MINDKVTLVEYYNTTAQFQEGIRSMAKNNYVLQSWRMVERVGIVIVAVYVQHYPEESR